MKIQDVKDFSRELKAKVKVWLSFHISSGITLNDLEQHEVAHKAFSPISYYLDVCRYHVRRILRLIRRTKLHIMYRLIPEHRYHVIDTGLNPGYHDLDYRLNNAMYTQFIYFFQKCGHIYCDTMAVEKAKQTWKEKITFKKPVLDLFEIGKREIILAGGLSMDTVTNWRSIPMDHNFDDSSKSKRDYHKLFFIYMWYHNDFLIYNDICYEELGLFLKERGYESQFDIEARYLRYATILFDLKVMMWN